VCLCEPHFVHASLAAAYGLNGETEQAFAALGEARNRWDRYSSVTPKEATGGALPEGEGRLDSENTDRRRCLLSVPPGRCGLARRTGSTCCTTLFDLDSLRRRHRRSPWSGWR
jgi:hypothetical protein